MAAGRLVQAGYVVLKPNKVVRYDFAVQTPTGELRLVQVKTGRLRRGTIIANAYSVDNKRKDDLGPVRCSSYVGQVDDFVIYSPDTDMAYLVPISVVGEKTQIRLRLSASRSLGGASATTLWAKDYVLERVTRVERATFSLATRCSTTELHPQESVTATSSLDEN